MITPDYIVGLADGEGSFSVYVRDGERMPSTKRRVRVEPKFCLKLIEKDKAILYQLKRFFGCGSVYFQRDVRANHQQCYRYEVYNREDLSRVIIPFFRQNRLKLMSKRHDFQIFCRLMRLMVKNQHLTPAGLQKMYRLKQMLH